MQTSEFKPRNDREKRMWNYMTAHPKFRYADVMKGANVPRHYIDIFTAKLRRLKLIKQVSREGSGQFYTVMDDAAAKAFEARKKGKKEGVIWTLMRSIKKFSPPEIMMAIAGERSDISEDDVRKYCSLLLKADYLAVIQKARPGVHPARYQLVNDTGPLPPVKRTLEVVVDGNEDRAVYAAGARL